MITIGSLFSGIGGLELGLEMAGLGPVRWQVEKDPWCRRVLARHWPEARRYEDVCDVGEELEPVDLICGGSPCQDLSLANAKGAGLDGPRSKLWFEMLRIVSQGKRSDGTVSWRRPSFVVFENVAHAAGRWFDTVCASLALQGYGIIPIPVEACHIGSPQRRARWLILAHLGSVELRLQPWWGSWENGQEAVQPAEHGSHAGWPTELEVVSPSDGVPRHVVRALGNCCIPQVAQVAGEMVKLVIERVKKEDRREDDQS